MRIAVEAPSAFTPPAFPATVYEPVDGRAPDRARQKHVQSATSGTTTERVASPVLSPDQQYESLHSARSEAAAKIRRDIAARIRELVADAIMSNEPLSLGSVADLVAFLGETSFTKRPAIYLLDNGNFRAVWKGADNEQAAFQFRGNNIVHCVFFFKRAASQLPLNLETVVDLIPNLRSKYPSFARLLHASPT